jgi:beta-galactosidase
VPTVEIKNRQVYVGKEKIPLLSGEMHYWRLNPSRWEECLDEMRSLGITTVATYIPWFYHEYKRGSFDFTGRTEKTRDLKGFLELLKKKKFWVIIRPGPYIYSECPNDGVPSYAYKYHRLHPTFIKYATVYMEKVCAVIKPFQATRRGGNVILLQADNEIDPWPDIFGSQYGLSAKPGLFQTFMEEHYKGDIDALNSAWGAQYASFKEVGPYVVHQIKGDKGLRRHLDYFEFKYYYSARVAEWAVALYQKCGITVPIYLNLYPFHHVHDWRRMECLSDMTGIDLYPENEFSADVHDHRKYMDKIRYTRTYSSVPYIAEFASGVWHNHHYACGVLTPNHYRLITLSALLAGVCGWNWYMLVNRDNWYMAPINEWGNPRPELTSVFKALIGIFYAMKPYECAKITDVAVTFNSLQYAAKTVPQNGHIGCSLYDADIDYEFFDPHTGRIDKPILFYSGNHWLCRESQENLYRYVERGGTLACFRSYPRQDEQFQDCNILGFIDPAKILFEFKRCCTVSLPDKSTFSTCSSIFSFDDVPGTPINADVSESGVFTVGYEKKIGKGRILHIGVEPNAQVLFAILRYLKVSIGVYSETTDIHTALFRRGKKFFLVVVNNGTENKNAKISIDVPEFFNHSFTWRDIEKKEKTIESAAALPVMSLDVLRKDGRVFELDLVSK